MPHCCDAALVYDSVHAACLRHDVCGCKKGFIRSFPLSIQERVIAPKQEQTCFYPVFCEARAGRICAPDGLAVYDTAGLQARSREHLLAQLKAVQGGFPIESSPLRMTPPAVHESRVESKRAIPDSQTRS